MNADRDSQNYSKNLADLPSGELLDAWKGGNNAAATILVERYWYRLVSMVDRRLNRQLRSLHSPDEFVQSALGSFFRSESKENHPLDSLSIWRLLATFAKRKMLRAIERESAIKRGGGKARLSFEAIKESLESPTDSFDPDSSNLLNDLAAQLPLDLQPVLKPLLDGFDQTEIATQLGIDPRTLRRKLVRIREFLQEPDAKSSNKEISFQSSALPMIPYSHFVLGKMIGDGAFGKVYRAFLRRDGSTVAVKFLRRSFWEHSGARTTFLREIEAASKVDHPSIIKYQGWGQSPHGGPYLISQWIEGTPLSSRCIESTQEFAKIFVDIVNAMLKVHQRGVIHGDLTPSNILCRSDDSIVITDFGFARSMMPTSKVSSETTNSENGRGTLGFAAPEQFSPAFGAISLATDIYSIGGIAYWALTGRAPHSADSYESSFASSISERDVDTSYLPARTPLEIALKEIAARTLRQSPSRRLKSIQDILELINRCHP